MYPLNPHVRPDTRQQFVFGDQTAGVPQQLDQHIERFRRHADRRRAALQPPPVDVQGEPAEIEDFAVAMRVFREC
jgi:hypothetical protein